MRNILAAEQIFYFADFELALCIAGIPAVGLALIADRRQPVRVDGQPKQLMRMRTYKVQHQRSSSSVSGVVAATSNRTSCTGAF